MGKIFDFEILGLKYRYGMVLSDIFEDGYVWQSGACRLRIWKLKSPSQRRVRQRPIIHSCYYIIIYIYLLYIYLAELNAPVDLAQKALEVETDLDIQNLLPTQYYTDSWGVLAWITNDSTKEVLKRSVTSRIDTKRKISNPNQWYYIPTTDNPADIGTRPITVKNLETSTWLKGLPFLSSNNINLFPKETIQSTSTHQSSATKASNYFITRHRHATEDITSGAMWASYLQSCQKENNLLNLLQTSVAQQRKMQKEVWPMGGNSCKILIHWSTSNPHQDSSQHKDAPEEASASRTSFQVLERGPFPSVPDNHPKSQNPYSTCSQFSCMQQLRKLIEPIPKSYISFLQSTSDAILQRIKIRFERLWIDSGKENFDQTFFDLVMFSLFLVFWTKND